MNTQRANILVPYQLPTYGESCRGCGKFLGHNKKGLSWQFESAWGDGSFIAYCPRCNTVQGHAGRFDVGDKNIQILVDSE